MSANAALFAAYVADQRAQHVQALVEAHEAATPVTYLRDSAGVAARAGREWDDLHPGWVAAAIGTAA